MNACSGTACVFVLPCRSCTFRFWSKISHIPLPSPQRRALRSRFLCLEIMRRVRTEEEHNIVLTDVAVRLGGLHQPVAGLVEEALGRLPVLGWRGVEKVVETFLVLLALCCTLRVALHEEVNIQQVPILDWTFLRCGPYRSCLQSSKEQTKGCQGKVCHSV